MESCPNLLELIGKWINEEVNNFAWHRRMYILEIGIRTVYLFDDILLELRALEPCECVVNPLYSVCIDCVLVIATPDLRHRLDDIRLRAKQTIRTALSSWPEFAFDLRNMPSGVSVEVMSDQSSDEEPGPENGRTFGPLR
jgi:hypothetical protein